MKLTRYDLYRSIFNKIFAIKNNLEIYYSNKSLKEFKALNDQYELWNSLWFLHNAKEINWYIKFLENQLFLLNFSFLGNNNNMKVIYHQRKFFIKKKNKEKKFKNKNILSLAVIYYEDINKNNDKLLTSDAKHLLLKLRDLINNMNSPISK